MEIEFKNKNIGIYGVGVSGISTVKALSRLDAKLTLIDSKSKEELDDVLNQINEIKYTGIFGDKDVDLSNLDLLVKSPGIPLTTEIIKKANRMNIEVISDLELAYLISKNKNIIVVTGTNGKTTTTTLIGEIFKANNKKTHITGNIGIGIMDAVLDSNLEDVLLVEASSFQLESTKYLKPYISLFINISPDHLDWHGSFDNYFQSKKKAFNNQDESDWSILNYEDENIRSISKELKSKILFFSSERELDQGVFIKDGKVYIRYENKTKYIMDISGLNIIKENLLAAIGVSYAYGLNMDLVNKVAENFSPLEHRMEFVTEKLGIEFYNDSKGTNPESTIKALQSIKGEKILIAGGYDKGLNYNDLIREVLIDTKHLVLIGQTKENIKKEALKQGFINIYEVETMKQAVEKAYELAKKTDKIILSPACASWGMYKNFEERGRDFKKHVKNIKVN